jgi:hypothetical protein
MTVRDLLDFQELMFCTCMRDAMRPSRRSPAIWRRKCAAVA